MGRAVKVTGKEEDEKNEAGWPAIVDGGISSGEGGGFRDRELRKVSSDV